jgi:hypothetical protein
LGHARKHRRSYRQSSSCAKTQRKERGGRHWLDKQLCLAGQGALLKFEIRKVSRPLRTLRPLLL